MKINVDYVSRGWYKDAPDGLAQWRFHFRKYDIVRGFILRIFGVHFNIRENNATEKIIENMKNTRMAKLDNTRQSKKLVD